MPINWQPFADLVRKHDRFLLTSHIRPDADALGSELGMAGVLAALGKNVVIVNAHATPPNLRFLDPRKQIKQLGVDVQPGDLGDRQVIVVLDTSAWIQLGSMADVVRSSNALKLVIDHHVSQDDLGAELFKDTTAEATGRLVSDAAEALGVALSPEIAMVLFAAVATDTGWYRFASATGNTFRCAGRLVDAGAQPSQIYKQLYEHDSLARLHLIGRTLARAEAELGGRLIHTSVTLEDFAATGAVPSDTEDVINMTLTVGGTEVALICVELVGGGVKFSFRSRPRTDGTQIDCSKVAEEFGGGGHKAAAGATLNEPCATARAKVLDAVRRAMR
ncbi:MAG TPA: DHH family phosphoesterase [Pirellulales bacterium]|nr:DHH family phosphoesterase [Pirellulales bacterium]